MFILSQLRTIAIARRVAGNAKLATQTSPLQRLAPLQGFTAVQQRSRHLSYGDTMVVPGDDIAMSLSEAVMSDHDTIAELENLYRSTMNKEEQKKWSNLLVWAIARHDAGEEIAVFPLMHEIFGQHGDLIAAKHREAHEVVKTHLTLMQGMEPGSAEYEEHLDAAMNVIRARIASEADVELPVLERAIGPGVSREAAGCYNKVKEVAAARTHAQMIEFLQMPVEEVKKAFADLPSGQEMLDGSA